MAVAGVDIWLIQAFCRWGSRAVLEYVRDCHLSSATDVAAKVAKGLRLMEVRENLYQHMEIAVGPERAVECEQKFEQVLETKVAEMDINELKHEDVKALIEKGMLKTVRETKVKFVLCAESGTGKLHIRKNGTTCWCGGLVSRCAGGVPSLPPSPPKKTDRCRKRLRSLAVGWTVPSIRCSRPGCPPG